jgi:hypothetical protein
MNSDPSRDAGQKPAMTTAAAKASVLVTTLCLDLAANEVPHQHGHQCNRQRRRCRHRIGLGECKRRKQSALLGFQREHRQEAQRDDQEGEEQRWSNFTGRLGDYAPAIVIRERLLFDVLVHVFDHHDGRIDHRPDRDRDAAERHDVCVDALQAHDDECDEDADRQADDHNHRRPEVKQEHRANQRHDQKFLDKLSLQVVDCALDQVRPVVGRHDLDTFRQTGGKFLQPEPDGFDGLRCVLSPAHDDNAAHNLALAVEIGDATPHLRSDTNLRDIRQYNGSAAFIDAQRDRGNIFDALEIAGGAHHVLRLAHFDYRAARFLVA